MSFIDDEVYKYEELFLFEAVKSNNVTLIKKILELKVDINVKDNYGWSVFRLAAWNNSKESVKLLINARADKASETIYEEILQERY